MLGTKYELGPSVDFAVQTSDPRSAQKIRDRISAQFAINPRICLRNPRYVHAQSAQSTSPSQVYKAIAELQRSIVCGTEGHAYADAKRGP